MQTKYIGTILDGRWKVIERIDRNKFKLQNIYNNQIIDISESFLYKVLRGESSISKLMCRRIGRNKFSNIRKFLNSERKQTKTI